MTKKNKFSVFLISFLIAVSLLGLLVIFVRFLTQSDATEQSASSSTVESTMISSTTISTTITAAVEETTASSVDPILIEGSTPMIDTNQLSANASQVSYGIYYFNDGRELLSESQPLVSASVIKVFIMEYIFNQANQGIISLDTLVDGETISTLVTRMIQVSDNEATNRLIDYFGMAGINNYLQSAGYSDTQLQRKMLDTTAQSEGLENYTSLNDTLAFLKQLYEQQASYPYSEMLNIMSGQQIATKIRSQLPADLQIANKTGELAGVENDIGIVFAENPYAVIVLSNGVSNSQAMRNAIGAFALAALTA